MSLPDDIIAHILEKRDVYVLNYYEPSFDLSRWKCLGVYNTLDAAKRAAVRTALESLDSFNVYDPAKRYYQRDKPYTNEKIWEDRWQYTLGVCIYTIEARQLDSEALPSETLYFNFDGYVKRLIADSRLSSAEARALLHGWKNDPPYGTLLELFSPEELRFREFSLEREREDWLGRYGCVSHYPYGEWDPL